MNVTKRRIAIATNGRFHVLDLARELAALGHDVLFYSALPDRRAERFGLDRRNCRSVLLPMLPVLIWERIAPRVGSALRERLYNYILNRAIIARIEPCDVFIGMSGLILEAASYARDRFGARIFLERGSQHILAQKEILERIGAEPPSDYAIERELTGYELADWIMIPSRHAAATFYARGFPREKIRLNVYGVDLDMFPRRAAPRGGPATILFVGSWAYQKGADVLVEAMRLLPNVRLLHVGPLGDAPFPASDRFEHVEPVDQSVLVRFYQQAHLFVLPSRQEGLAMVQLQALATGLPLVCSDQTGGGDLRLSERLGQRIAEVPVEDSAALASAIRVRLDTLEEFPEIEEKDRQLLSWRRYGVHYGRIIEDSLSGV